MLLNVAGGGELQSMVFSTQSALAQYVVNNLADNIIHFNDFVKDAGTL